VHRLAGRLAKDLHAAEAHLVQRADETARRQLFVHLIPAAQAGRLLVDVVVAQVRERARRRRFAGIRRRCLPEPLSHRRAPPDPPPPCERRAPQRASRRIATLRMFTSHFLDLQQAPRRAVADLG